jgi:hypothetical protein
MYQRRHHPEREKCLFKKRPEKEVCVVGLLQTFFPTEKRGNTAAAKEEEVEEEVNSILSSPPRQFSLSRQQQLTCEMYSKSSFFLHMAATYVVGYICVQLTKCLPGPGRIINGKPTPRLLSFIADICRGGLFCCLHLNARWVLLLKYYSYKY